MCDWLKSLRVKKGISPPQPRTYPIYLAVYWRRSGVRVAATVLMPLSSAVARYDDRDTAPFVKSTITMSGFLHLKRVYHWNAFRERRIFLLVFCT